MLPHGLGLRPQDAPAGAEHSGGDRLTRGETAEPASKVVIALETTEMTLVTGVRYQIQGSVEQVEAAIIAASRGSIMQLAWLTEQSGEKIGVNPTSVVSLRGGAT